MKSELFKLNWKDALKGCVVAVLSAGLTAVVTVLQSGAFPTTADWKNIAMVAVTAGASYILKNFLTNSNDQMLKKDGE